MTAEQWSHLHGTLNLNDLPYDFVRVDKGSQRYIHPTTILGLSFTPDDRHLVLGGGGAIPNASGNVAIVEVESGNLRSMLPGHVNGVHDISIDPATGIIASASFDYTLLLWNTQQQEATRIGTVDTMTKEICQFSPVNSLLAFGEYAYYGGHNNAFYLLDLLNPERYKQFSLPEGQEVTGLAFYHDQYLMASTTDGENSTVKWISLEDWSEAGDVVVSGELRSIGFPGGSVPICGTSLTDKLIVSVDPSEGNVLNTAELESLPGAIVFHPSRPEIAVSDQSEYIKIYDSGTMQLQSALIYRDPEETSNFPTSLAYSNDGSKLAYGLREGAWGVFELNGV